MSKNDYVLHRTHVSAKSKPVHVIINTKKLLANVFVKYLFAAFVIKYLLCARYYAMYRGKKDCVK